MRNKIINLEVISTKGSYIDFWEKQLYYCVGKLIFHQRKRDEEEDIWYYHTNQFHVAIFIRGGFFISISRKKKLPAMRNKDLRITKVKFRLGDMTRMW